jgi:hypothetical protein
MVGETGKGGKPLALSSSITRKKTAGGRKLFLVLWDGDFVIVTGWW